MAGKKIIIITVLFIALAIPATINLLKQQTGLNSRASAPDKLEAEAGTVNPNAQIFSDSTASGGKYVKLNSASAPTTPTSAPNPTIPANSLYVPNSIDSTGNTDVSSQLQTYINNAPNGSTIVFKSGGTYLISQGMRLGNRSGITLEGNGATLKITGYDRWGGSAILVDGQNSNTKIRNFTIVGNNTTSGTTGSCCTKEGQHGVIITGSTNTTVENMNISYVGGDCVYMAYYNNTVINDGITVRNITCSYTGRHGADIKGNKNVLIENNSFDKIGLHVFNLEMNKAGDSSTDVIIRNNTVGSYSHTGNYKGWVLGANGAEGSTVKNITLTGNTIKGGISGKTGTYRGLTVTVDGRNKIRENFTITNNICTTPVIGPAMEIYSVNGLTVTGNTQPLSSGSLVSVTGSTNVVVGPNNTN
jgi:hypothetical protein